MLSPYDIHTAAAGRDRALQVRRSIVIGTVATASLGVGLLGLVAWNSDSGKAAASAPASTAGQGTTLDPGSTCIQAPVQIPGGDDGTDGADDQSAAPVTQCSLRPPRQAPQPAARNQAPTAVSGGS